MSINTYSLKKDAYKKVAENFIVKEFACKDGSDKILISTELIELLQKIRNHFGRPLTITSAYRTNSYNTRIGGVSESTHTKGIAADIVISGIKPILIAEYIEYIMPECGGIGLYADFVHTDVRANRSRWTNFGTEIVTDGFYGYKPHKKNIQTAADAVDVLADNGIIDTPEIWYKGTWTDENLKQFMINAANYVLNGGVANDM